MRLLRSKLSALQGIAIATALTIFLYYAVTNHVYMELSLLAVTITKSGVSRTEPPPTQGLRQHRERGNESQSPVPVPILKSRRNQALLLDNVDAPDEVALLPLEFRRPMTRDENGIYKDLLVTLSEVARRNNITVFMNYGTLLGSIRHQDIIPWDDDADIGMPYSQRDLIWSLINDRGYSAIKTADTVYRFVSPRSRRHVPQGLPWPFVDIDLYSENATHLWFMYFGSRITYRRIDVFPLHERPLGSIYFPAPRDALSCLKHTYGKYDMCESSGFSHRLYMPQNVLKLPCEALSKAYAFVHRSLASDGVVWERLVLGNRTLRRGATHELSSTAAISPYTLQPARIR